MPSKRDIKCRLCPAMIDRQNTTGLCLNCYQSERHNAIPSERVLADREKAAAKQELASLKKKYDACIETITRQEKTIKALGVLGEGIETFKIEPRKSEGSEGTVIVPASDWHIEEEVKPGHVSGLNTFNLEIAHARAKQFFTGALRLTNILQQDITVNEMILPLLGDFISNDIHDEFPEVNQLTPTHAIVTAQNMIISGFEFLLNNSKLQLTVPCHSGNHARTTRRVHAAEEAGHSLEYLMYLHLAAYFRGEKRIQFIVPEGYHSYVQVYDKTVRFHHGHEIHYQGGVGGIFIPAFKAIAQWNKARVADLDVFGHFHQEKDGGSFVSNGSLIGYNAYALRNKFDYEPPKQTLMLMDKKRGRTCKWPVLL